MIKAKIALTTKSDVTDFVNCFDGDEYCIVDGTGRHCVAAKSLIGVIYAWTEWDDMYLINETRDGQFPAAIEKFRA